MKDTATIAIIGIPANWNISQTIVGVWSECGYSTRSLDEDSYSVCIPIQGRFIKRAWRFVFIAELEHKKLLIWKIMPADAKELHLIEANSAPFHLLHKWGYFDDDDDYQKLFEQARPSNGG